jgi:Holliday junction resolvase RusA-like endonuclease
MNKLAVQQIWKNEFLEPPFPSAFPDYFGYEVFLGSCSFPMSLISKSNHKGKSRHLPKRFSTFEDVIGMIARQAYKPLKLVDAWVFLEARFKARRHVDYTNAFKSVLDGLVKGEVLQDDKYVLGCNLPFLYEKNTEENFTVHLFTKPFPLEKAR